MVYKKTYLTTSNIISGNQNMNVPLKFISVVLLFHLVDFRGFRRQYKDSTDPLLSFLHLKYGHHTKAKLVSTLEFVFIIKVLESNT